MDEKKTVLPPQIPCYLCRLRFNCPQYEEPPPVEIITKTSFFEKIRTLFLFLLIPTPFVLMGLVITTFLGPPPVLDPQNQILAPVITQRDKDSPPPPPPLPVPTPTPLPGNLAKSDSKQ
jgi:hypothetical protein